MIPSPHLTQFYIIRDEYRKLLYFDLQHLFNDLGSLTELFSIKWGDFESIFIWDTSYAAFLLGLYCEIFSLEHNRHDPAIHLVAKQYTIRTPQGSIIGQSHLHFEKPWQWSWKLSGWKHGLGKPWCVDSVFLEQLDSNQNKCTEEMWNASYLVWILCGHIPNVKQSCIIKEIYFWSYCTLPFMIKKLSTTSHFPLLPQKRPKEFPPITKSACKQ